MTIRVLVEVFVIVLMVLVLLGYFTMLERKLLGYAQLRKGPNKGVIFGLMQPMLDGFKLFMKGFYGGFVGSFVSYFIFPMLGLIAVLTLWVFMGSFIGIYMLSQGFLLALFIGSVVAVLFFTSGFLSGGKYSVLGSMRALAQALSYEGALIFACVSVLCFSWSASLSYKPGFMLAVFIFPMLIVGAVMESNRTPVDFVEGESELVSGLATEMGGLSFSLLFLMEYGVMSFYSVFVMFLYLGTNDSSCWNLLFVIFMFCFMNWLRMALPRSRYDLSMVWGWKVLLVSCFLVLIMVMGLGASI